jgi:hypothetical protein
MFHVKHLQNMVQRFHGACRYALGNLLIPRHQTNVRARAVLHRAPAGESANAPCRDLPKPLRPPPPRNIALIEEEGAEGFAFIGTERHRDLWPKDD